MSKKDKDVAKSDDEEKKSLEEMMQEKPEEEKEVQPEEEKKDENQEEPAEEEKKDESKKIAEAEPKFWKTFMGSQEYSPEKLGEYLEKVEKSYSHSMQEGPRLAKRVEELEGMIESDNSSGLDPKYTYALDRVLTDDEREFQEAWDKVVKDYPEIVSEELNEEYTKTFVDLKKANIKIPYEKAMRIVAQAIVNREPEAKQPEQKAPNKAIVKMAEGGIEQGSSDVSSKKPKESLTEAEREVAKNFGLTDEQYIEGKKIANNS